MFAAEDGDRFALPGIDDHRGGGDAVLPPSGQALSVGDETRGAGLIVEDDAPMAVSGFPDRQAAVGKAVLQGEIGDGLRRWVAMMGKSMRFETKSGDAKE